MNLNEIFLIFLAVVFQLLGYRLPDTLIKVERREVRVHIPHTRFIFNHHGYKVRWINTHMGKNTNFENNKRIKQNKLQYYLRLTRLLIVEYVVEKYNNYIYILSIFHIHEG